MNTAEAKAFTDAVADWVKGRPDLDALVMAGSWARGTARPDSDLDLLLLSRQPNQFRTDHCWLSQIVFPNPLRLVSQRDATYGAVWSRHLFFEPAAELELSFGALSWASTVPIDPGTLRVVATGFKVIVDKAGRLNQLLQAIPGLT